MSIQMSYRQEKEKTNDGLRRSLRLVVLVLGCIAFHGHADAQYLHPKIVEKKVQIRKAVILPAKVEITKESAKGSEMMVAESEQISVQVSDALAKSLEQKQINVVKGSFDAAATATTDGRKYTLADIQGRYDSLLPKLIKKSGDVKKGRFSLGDEVMLLNIEEGVDVVVFIRGTGRVFTKGKTAFSLLNIFSFDFPFAQITIGIVDARSGEVLAFTKPLSASKILSNPKELAKLITKSLKKSPAAP